MKKVVFVEGLPSVGKTYLVNEIRKMNLQNVYVVDEIINPDIKNTFLDSEDKFLKSDEMKLNEYNDGIVVIDNSANKIKKYLDAETIKKMNLESQKKLKNNYNLEKNFDIFFRKVLGNNYE